VQRAVESRSPAAVRVAEEDEEARIRLLRGHAHAACLSYERAVADFSDAREILEGLEASGAPMGETTAAHADAGLGVCYCNMRLWQRAIDAGERAIAKLAFDDIARTHVSRSVETARQHLCIERQASARSGGMRRPRDGAAAAAAGRPRPPPVAAPRPPLSAAAPRPAPPEPRRRAPPAAPPPAAKTRAGTDRPPEGSPGSRARAAAADLRAEYEAASRGEPRDAARPLGAPLRPGGGKSVDALESLRSRTLSDGAAADAKADEPPSPGNLSSAGSIPKSLSIASVAMSLSMASIASDAWELNGDWTPAAGDKPTDDGDVGLALDDSGHPDAQRPSAWARAGDALLAASSGLPA